jgi:hypothetical protein
MANRSASFLQMVVTAPTVKGFDLSGWRVVIGGARLPKGLAMAATKPGIKVYAGCPGRLGSSRRGGGPPQMGELQVLWRYQRA